MMYQLDDVKSVVFIVKSVELSVLKMLYCISVMLKVSLYSLYRYNKNL